MNLLEGRVFLRPLELADAVAGDDVIGYVDLAGTEPERRELGYVVGPSERWGRGLGGIVARLGVASYYRCFVLGRS